MELHEMIEKLRRDYSGINALNPEGEAYPKLCEYLDGLDTDTLELLAIAQIRWISPLAHNRINKRLFA